MQTFKIKWFSRWAENEGLTDTVLLSAVSEMNSGLIDANLGGNVYKKRVAKLGQGKSGSTRTILAFKKKDKAFFIYGFAKNIKDNISKKELQALKLLASELLNYNDDELKTAIKKGEIIEVKDNG